MSTAHDLCFNITPSKVYFFSKKYSKICNNQSLSKIYIPPHLTKKSIIFEMIYYITKNLSNENIYILQFNFDESEININDKFFKKIKFKVKSNNSYKNIPIQKILVYYAKNFENYKRHNYINMYIDIIEPIVFAKENLRKNEILDEHNIYFKYKINTTGINDFLSLNELNNSKYKVIRNIIKNEEIRLNKVQKD
ncbi:hypothetical protein [Borreliella afzelii]|uniref:hypothetical protein n=1 Tax=Borreliella afzelii TaxID=29518 RepID=UPI00028A9708|nr:hypothetical protein BafHLJ01_0852 [Borreliella afzelii HLJ01]